MALFFTAKGSGGDPGLRDLRMSPLRPSVARSAMKTDPPAFNTIAPQVDSTELRVGGVFQGFKRDLNRSGDQTPSSSQQMF